MEERPSQSDNKLRHKSQNEMPCFVKDQIDSVKKGPLPALRKEKQSGDGDHSRPNQRPFIKIDFLRIVAIAFIYPLWPSLICLVRRHSFIGCCLLGCGHFSRDQRQYLGQHACSRSVFSANRGCLLHMSLLRQISQLIFTKRTQCIIPLQHKIAHQHVPPHYGAPGLI